MGDRRQDRRRLKPGCLCVMAMGVPATLPVPGAAVREILEVHPPAAVAALHHMNPTGLVTTVGVVVCGEKVAEVIKDEFLGIPQAEGELLEFTAVAFTEKHGSGLGPNHVPTVRRDHVVAAVTDAEIDASVVAERESVQIVPTEGDPHAIAVLQDGSLVGDAVPVGIAKPPEPGNTGVVDVAVDGENASARALLDAAEATRKDHRLIADAVTVGIGQQSNAVLLLGVCRSLLAEEPVEHRHPLVDRPQGQVCLEPVTVAAVVFDSLTLTEGLTDEDATLFVKAEGDRVLHLRLGRDQTHRHARGERELRQGGFGFGAR